MAEQLRAVDDSRRSEAFAASDLVARELAESGEDRVHPSGDFGALGRHPDPHLVARIMQPRLR